MRALIFALALLLPATAQASFLDDWDSIDRLLLQNFTAVLILDWGQTLTIAEDDRFIETNVYLGKYPTKAEVNLYFPALYLGTVFVANKVPGWARKVVLAWFLVEHFRAVENNNNNGVKFQIPLIRF